MPISTAILRANDLLNRHPIVGEGNFSETIELGFSLSASIASKNHIVTFKLVDEEDQTMYPNGVLMLASYSLGEGGLERPYQVRLCLNTVDSSKLSGLGILALGQTHAKSALGSEVISLIFNKMKAIN